MKFKIAREPFHDFERGKLCPSYSGFIKRRKNKNQGLFFHLAIITQRSPKTAPPKIPPKSQKYSKLPPAPASSESDFPRKSDFFPGKDTAPLSTVAKDAVGAAFGLGRTYSAFFAFGVAFAVIQPDEAARFLCKVFFESLSPPIPHPPEPS